LSNVVLQPLDAVADIGGLDRTICPGCGNGDAKDFLQGPDRFNGRRKLYRLVRCSQCSLVFLRNPPPASEMAEHYGSDYDRLIGKGASSLGYWEPRKRLISHYKAAGTLLDLGCSSGSFLESMRGPHWQLAGIEMSADAAKMAEARSGGQIFHGDILEASFPPESFDVITCFDVLEHVYEPRSVLAKVREWLKPDGIFYLMVPNIDSAAVRVFRSYWYGLELPRHLTHFSPDSLRAMAAVVGLETTALPANRFPAVEYSARYLVDDLLRGMGASRTPLSLTPELGIPGRIARKAFRLCILPLVHIGISLVGPEEYIHAVLTKNMSFTSTPRGARAQDLVL